MNYNGKRFLKRCLSSVLSQRYLNFEAIFVDNASVDGSVGFAKNLFADDPRLKIIVNKKNYGVTRGLNIGAKYADGEYVIFLNNDTEVDPDWLGELIWIMSRDSKIGAAGCKQLFMDGKRIEGIGGFIDAYGFIYPRGRLEADLGQYDKVEEVFATGTTALAVRKDVFNKVGGFDPKYFMCYEEYDLCWRIWLSGHKVVSVPSSIVYHVSGGSKLSLSRFIFHNEKNRIATLVKNYNLNSLLRVMPILAVFEILQIIIFLLNRKLHYMMAIARAILWNILSFKYVWNQHLKVDYGIRRVHDTDIVKRIKKIDFTVIWHKVRALTAN